MKLTQTLGVVLLTATATTLINNYSPASEQQQAARSFPTLCKEYVGTAIDYFRRDSKHKE